MGGIKSSVFFMFGPKPGSYILGTPNKVWQNKIPTAMALQLSDIKTIRTAVLDKQNRWFMYFQTRDNDYTYSSSMSFNEYYDPGPLSWLTRELSTWKSSWPIISASLGPSDSLFFALPSGECGYSDTLPANTEKSVKKVNGYHLTQGVNRTFVILHGRKKCHWLLKDEYPMLNGILEKVTGRYTVTYVALNPFTPNEFFLMLEDKIAFFHVAPAIHAAVTDALNYAGIPSNIVRKDGTTAGTGATAEAPATKQELFEAIETAITGYNLVNLAGGLQPVTAAAGCLVM